MTDTTDLQAGLVDIHTYHLGCGHIRWTCAPLPENPPVTFWCHSCNLDAAIVGWEPGVVQDRLAADDDKAAAGAADGVSHCVETFLRQVWTSASNDLIVEAWTRRLRQL